MFTKILLPLDGSEVSAQAIPQAVELARKTGAAIVLLQVIDSEAQLMSQVTGMAIEPMAAGSMTVEAARGAVQAQREAAEANLQAALKRLQDEGVQGTAEIREGVAGDTIVQAVTDLGCDVVVIATHGRSGFKRAILGSVADHVARHASASVMLVRATDGAKKD